MATPEPVHNSRPRPIRAMGATFGAADLMRGNEIGAGSSATGNSFPPPDQNLSSLSTQVIPQSAATGGNGVSTALQSSIYNLVIANEVSSNGGTADKLALVNGDWSFGWIQDDFNKGQANALLTGALGAANYSPSIIPTIQAAFDSFPTNPQGVQIGPPGTNSVGAINALLGGLVGPDGKSVTVNSINKRISDKHRCKRHN